MKKILVFLGLLTTTLVGFPTGQALSAVPIVKPTIQPPKVNVQAPKVPVQAPKVSVTQTKANVMSWINDLPNYFWVNKKLGGTIMYHIEVGVYKYPTQASSITDKKNSLAFSDADDQEALALYLQHYNLKMSDFTKAELSSMTHKIRLCRVAGQYVYRDIQPPTAVARELRTLYKTNNALPVTKY